MKFTKKHWTILIIAIIALIFLLFLIINLKLFNKSICIFRESKKCCENLSIGDKCSFDLNGKNITGICEKTRRGISICRSNKINK
jgi:YbbR domain-containing protein